MRASRRTATSEIKPAAILRDGASRLLKMRSVGLSSIRPIPSFMKSIYWRKTVLAMSPQPIIIAGGGIGGLAAAVGLAQKGVPTIVLEKAPALGEIGAGIQLGPNAFHCFDYLGVGTRRARSRSMSTSCA